MGLNNVAGDNLEGVERKLKVLSSTVGYHVEMLIALYIIVLEENTVSLDTASHSQKLDPSLETVAQQAMVCTVNENK